MTCRRFSAAVKRLDVESGTKPHPASRSHAGGVRNTGPHRREIPRTLQVANKPPSRSEKAIVPVLSLGETRRFVIRPKVAGRGHATTFTVRGGDLLVMGGRCQRDFEHAVPKELKPAGTRVSVNFGSSAQSSSSF